ATVRDSVGSGVGRSTAEIDVDVGVLVLSFFFSSRRRHTRSVSAFLLNRSSDLDSAFAEVDLVHQQTQNQRYGSSHIGATAKDISNVVTDAASGVVEDRKSVV